jgi:hypothetical protein
MFPASRKPDASFRWGENDFVRVQFKDGVEVPNEN